MLGYIQLHIQYHEMTFHFRQNDLFSQRNMASYKVYKTRPIVSFLLHVTK